MAAKDRQSPVVPHDMIVGAAQAVRVWGIVWRVRLSALVLGGVFSGASIQYNAAQPVAAPFPPHQSAARADVMQPRVQTLVRSLFQCCPRSIRSGLERWARGRIVRRTLGKRFGGRPFYASPEAALFWAFPWATAEIDDDLMRFCEEFVHPGSVVWDFGGHLGIFAFAAAQRAGPNGYVLSLEPDPFLAHLMIKTESERPSTAAPCTVLGCAVGSEPGFATLEVPERSRAANALAGKSISPSRGGVRQRFDVPIVTAAELAEKYPAPNVLKMDIEGSELDALRGGEDVFAAVRPVMMLEVYANIADETARLLKRWNYKLFDAEAHAVDRTEVHVTCHNTLAIPR